jgi:hypothetical protein
MGPSGIMSLDSFGDIGGAGAAGVDTAASGGANEGAGFSGRSPAEMRDKRDKSFEDRIANERAALQIAERAQAKALGEKERRNIAMATYGPLQKYTGRSSLFGGANRFGYTNVRPDGTLQPGYGGRLFGGLMSLLTGIPFVGSAIGRAYDYGKGIFGSKPRDMSQFNRLGLFGLPPGTLDEEDKIAQPLTEAELNAYSRFGDIGLPNQNTVISDPNKAFNVNLLAQPTYNLDGTVRPNAFNYTTDFDINTGQFDDNNFGITNTQTFDDSPYGRIRDDDMVP